MDKKTMRKKPAVQTRQNSKLIRLQEKQKSRPEKTETRPPIVVVLGHIDHGKSSLLEAIRDFRITAKESGGITQHIGAYQIEEKGKKITFIDTPGHEAFSEMRSRGAKVADIAILVIDAAEGVKAQTKEAVRHIKGAGVPVIVALNKTDKPDADSERVKRELMKEDVLVESLGGKTLAVEISAKTGKGIAELLDLILLAAEMEELKASRDKPAKGVIIESYLDNLRGATATLLLTEGVLQKGDIVGTVSSFVKIKTLENFQGKTMEKAFPSDPVIVFGFNQAPKLGEEFLVFPDSESVQNNIGQPEKKESPGIFEISEGQKVLNLILKTDVLGSLEAVEGILKNLPQEKTILKLVKAEVGGINESDLKLAVSTDSVVLGFRTKIAAGAKSIAEREKIKVMTFDIIYELVEWVRNYMVKIQAPEDVRLDLGKLKVLAKFLTDKNRQIIGGRVIEGEIRKGAKIEVLRGDEKIGQGKLVNLQRNKKDANLISKGEECGLLFEGDVKIEQGDVLVFFVEEKRRI